MNKDLASLKAVLAPKPKSKTPRLVFPSKKPGLQRPSGSVGN